MSETMSRTANDLGADFDRLYAREIAPHARDMEAKRQSRVAAFYRRIGVSVPMLAVAAGALYTIGFLQDQPVWSAFILVLGAVAAGYWISRPAAKHREELKDLVIAPICHLLGDLHYSRKAKGGFDTQRFREAGVVGNYNRSKLEDLFTGRHRDTDFRMVEAKLRRANRGSKRSSSRTVFKGCCSTSTCPSRFPAGSC